MFVYKGKSNHGPSVTIADGTYIIRNVRDNTKVFDIQGDSKENRANIQLYDNLHNDVQKFRIIKQNDYYLIQSVYSGLWLDIEYTNGYGQPGNSVQLYNSYENQEEHWVFEDAGNGNVYIKSLYGVYLDTGGATDNNTNIITYEFDGTTSQQWTLVKVSESQIIRIPDGIYKIQNVRDRSKVMDIQYDSTDNHANIQLFDDLSNNVQKFRVINRDGYCNIQSVYSEYWLDTQSPANMSGCNIQLFSNNTLPEEKWIFEDAGNGDVFIRSFYDVYIDTAGGKTDNYTNIETYFFDGTTSQQWRFIEVEHTWDSGIITTEPTWFMPGVRTFTCKTCHATMTEPIPMFESPNPPQLVRVITNTDHTYYLYASNYDWMQAKEWCEAYGGYLATITSAAEQNVIDQLIGEDSQTSFWLGAESHTTGSFRWITCENWTYENWQTGEPNAPEYETCLGTYLGTNWNDFSNSSLTPKGFILEKGDIDESKTNHLWNSGVVTTAPTCASSGVKTYICTVCGGTKTETIAVLGHSWGNWTYLNGTSHQRVCARDASHKETANHTWDAGKVTKEPTCTASGVKTYTCSVCKGTKTETVSALGHAEKAVSGREPTCTESGMTNGIICERCGEVLTAQTTVPALGHSWSAWTTLDENKHQRVCSRDSSHKETASHTWDSGKVTTSPSCTESGVKTYTCTVCGGAKTETISALGHDWSEWTASTIAFFHERVCKNDPSHVEKRTHNWDEGTVTKAPTCTADGTKVCTCVDCKKTNTVIISALGHQDQNGDEYCDICGAFLGTGTVSLQLLEMNAEQVKVGLYYDNCVGLKSIDLRIDFDNSILHFYKLQKGKDAKITDEPNYYTHEHNYNQDSDPSCVKYAAYFQKNLWGSEKWEEEGIPGVNGEHFEAAVLIFDVADLHADSTELTLSITNISGIDPNCNSLTLDLSEIPKPHEHTFGPWSVTVPATCLGNGERVCTCTVCGETKTETVPALGHDWSAWVKLDETYHQRVCGRNASHVETAAHEWDDGVRVSGGTKYTCATCSATRTVEDPTPVETDLDLEVASVKTQAGETVTLDVYITKAAPVNYLRLTPTYDKNVLTLTEVRNGDLFDTLEKGTSFLFNAESDVNATGLLATLTFTVAEGAEAGDYEIGLSVKEAWDYNEDLLHVGVTPGVITVRDFIYGDVNGDGVIDGRDLVRLRKYLANLDETTGVSAVEIFPGADCTGDGTVDGRDLIRLRKYLANYDEETGTSPIVLGP